MALVRELQNHREKIMNEEKPEAPKPVAKSFSWLYEIPVFYFLLVLLQRASFPDNPGFHLSNPSPFWLGVLLFGLRYGLPAGLASGLASALLYAWGIRQAGEGFRFEDAEFYFQPGLFLVIGAALGGTGDRFSYIISGLKYRIEDMMGRNRGLQNQIESQQKTLRAIEQQIVSQMSSVVTLYHGSRELGSLDRATLMPSILEFFTKALQARKTSLYLPKDGRWTLLKEFGWESADEYPREVLAGQGLVDQAAAERRTVSLRDMLITESDLKTGENSDAVFKKDAIMAAPLLDPSGEVAAVFAVQAMPFLQFNSASVNLLSLLSAWGSESLAKCIHVEELHSRSLMDEEFSVHSAGYFESRAKQEFARSKRYALPFSVLIVSPQKVEAASEERTLFLRAVCRTLRDVSRDLDIVTRTPRESEPFAVLMLTATRGKAEEMRDRLLEAFKVLEFPASVRVGVGSYSPAMQTAEEIVEQARTELR
jgi:GGDEF domain-containing protein